MLEAPNQIIDKMPFSEIELLNKLVQSHSHVNTKNQMFALDVHQFHAKEFRPKHKVFFGSGQPVINYRHLCSSVCLFSNNTNIKSYHQSVESSSRSSQQQRLPYQLVAQRIYLFYLYFVPNGFVTK